MKKLGIVLLLVLIPGVPLEVPRAKADFDEEGVRHVPTFDREQTWRYEDITDVEVFPHQFSRLQFRDGRTLKVWTMRADPRIVEAIVRQKWPSRAGESTAVKNQ